MTIVPPEAALLTGRDRFRPTGLTVRQFWQWAFSDLRANIVRGVLAEFLVAKAVGDPAVVRGAWGNYDVERPSDGSTIRIEVKSAAYLQSWRQRRLSRIVFSGLSGRPWDDIEGYGPEREIRADVFVFAVQTAESHDVYDLLDVDQWRFYVLPARVVREHGSRSLRLAFLKRTVGQVSWDGLAAAVDDAYESK